MQEEIYGTRDRRFVGWEHAQLLSMVDADCVLFLEYHDRTKEPVALSRISCVSG